MLIVDTSSWPMHKYILRNFLGSDGNSNPEEGSTFRRVEIPV